MKAPYQSLKKTFKIVGTKPQGVRWAAVHRFLVALHFSGSAYGKDVRAVRARVGVLMQEPPARGGESFWDGALEVKLDRKGDHYFAKADLAARSSYVCPRAKGVVAVYHVTFADGSELDTPEQTIKTERAQQHLDRHQAEQAAAAAQRRFESLLDARESTSWELLDQLKPAA